MQAKKNRSSQYLFINERNVFCPLVSDAVKIGYKTRIGESFFPIFVLHFSLPPKYIDVNVHPQKKEVRLREEFYIQQEISKAISSSLEQTKEIKNEHKSHSISPNIFFDMKQTVLQNEFVDLKMEDNDQKEEENQKDILSFIEKDKKKISFSSFFLLGSYFFINVKERLFPQNNSEIVMVDLFSAYNRYIFDSFKEKKKIVSQSLVVPYVIDLSNDEIIFLEQVFSSLHKIGFICRLISDRTISIDAYPSFLKKNEIILFFQKFLHEFNNVTEIENELEKKLARKISLITKSSKSNFSYEEAMLITEKLFECSDPFYSPLGKPIILPLTEEQVNKIFR